MLRRRRKNKKPHRARSARRRAFKRATRALRHQAPHRRRRRRRSQSTALVRANPARVLLANPYRRKASKPTRRRRRRSSARRRRQSHAIAHSMPHAFKRKRRAKLHRRKSNPFGVRLGKWGPEIRAAISGGLGIIAVRLSSGLYNKYVAQHVAGDGSSRWRQVASEIVRVVVVMGGTALLGIKLAKFVPGKLLDAQAFKIGGLAESGRQAIGVLVKQLAPKADLNVYGLSGGYDPSLDYAYEQQQMGDPGSGYYGQLSPGAMSGLEEWDSFAGFDGMDGVEDIDSFDGPTTSVRSARHSAHPFAGAAGGGF